MTALAQAHEDLRPLMFSVAYRMLGSVAEAEDVVQEALLRMTSAEAEGAQPDNLDAWATTVTTRLAIDTLRSARERRESYVGPWLPEPLVEGRGPDPADQVALDDSVSVAMLVLMETLTPQERAVFNPARGPRLRLRRHRRDCRGVRGCLSPALLTGASAPRCGSGAVRGVAGAP